MAIDGISNHLVTTIEQSRRDTHIERYNSFDSDYSSETLTIPAIVLRIKEDDGTYVAAPYNLDDTIALRDGLTKIIDSIVPLRPKSPAFSDLLDAAEVGSTVKVGRYPDVYVKIEGGRWMNTSTRNTFSSTDFQGNASDYTLTPPAPLTLPQRMLAAPFGSTVQIGSSKYLKVGPTQDNWVNLTYGGTDYKAEHFTTVGDIATLTLAE